MNDEPLTTPLASRQGSKKRVWDIFEVVRELVGSHDWEEGVPASLFIFFVLLETQQSGLPGRNSHVEFDLNQPEARQHFFFVAFRMQARKMLALGGMY